MIQIYLHLLSSSICSNIIIIIITCQSFSILVQNFSSFFSHVHPDKPILESNFCLLQEEEEKTDEEEEEDGENEKIVFIMKKEDEKRFIKR